MKKVAQILFSGLGGHGSVAFTLLEDFKVNFKNTLIFYGSEPLIDDYILKCEKLQVEYKYFHTSQKLDLVKYILGNNFYAVINHNIQLSPIISFTKFMKRFKLISVEHDPLNLKKRRDILLSKLAYNFSDNLVILTESYKEFYRQKITRNLKKLVLIPNGIDTKKYSPLEKKTKHDLITIVMISRITESKDHETLLRGLKLFFDENPRAPFQVKIGGDGNKKSQLEELTKELNLVNQVHFLGLLSETEVVSTLQTADIYLHCSLSETMPTALMQALSSGLPTLASNIDGNFQIMKKIGEHNMYTPKDPQDFKDKLGTFIKKDLQMLSNINRQFAVDNLSMDSMISKYKKLI